MKTFLIWQERLNILAVYCENDHKSTPHVTFLDNDEYFGDSFAYDSARMCYTLPFLKIFGWIKIGELK